MTRIDSSPTPPAYPVSDGDPPGTRAEALRTSDPLSELAELMVENDALRAALDQDRLRSARAAQERAARDEVRQLNEAADYLIWQSCVQGGLAALGNGISAVASFRQAGNPPAADDDLVGKIEYERVSAQNEGWAAIGGALSALAAPVGELAGGIDKRRAEAAAREAAHRVTRAAGDAEDARTHAQQVDRHTDSVLGLVESIQEAEHQGNVAILSRF